MRIQITKINFSKKPPHVGYFNIFIPKWGVDINSLSLFERDGVYSFTLPSHQYINKTGETKYAPYFRFKEVKHWEGFQKEILKAVHLYLDSKEQHA
jgi:hypothetical protein